ncbi:hypothetical protein [Streptomyces resistomycificus]|uniref:Uncharacterized protein n=1 Tax=Streptomyces resistomycificus TaxID=67356 RepID=A0A0L8LAQ7_9ACTN|nr:hypothetical protein [Streptomyces resistomycificus]KOG35189.1 hypothetical protein ADK37_16305 [Streptomyces resistomycificus]KUN99949.1 hypothetical protein AQJ84_09705 [Streptomyces resistomycificus]
MDPDRPSGLPRRHLIGRAAMTGALATLPTFTATAAPRRPVHPPLPDADPRHELWWRAPADDRSVIEQGLPVGHGHLGALAGNDPGREVLPDLTRRHVNDPRNRYRNLSGRKAGWTVAISTNPHGGNGWWWRPGGSTGAAPNLFDIHEVSQGRGIFQTDAHFGTPAAMTVMLLYSRPGHIEQARTVSPRSGESVTRKDFAR